MGERHAPRVQTQRQVVRRKCLLLSQEAVFAIHWVADDREAEVPQVHANLVRAARVRGYFKQTGAIREALLHDEIRVGLLAIRRDGARTVRAGARCDWGATFKCVAGGMADDAGEVALGHGAHFKLWLQAFRETGGTAEDREA